MRCQTFEKRGNSPRGTTYLPGTSCHRAPRRHEQGLSDRQCRLLCCVLNNLSSSPTEPGKPLPHGQLPACPPVKGADSAPSPSNRGCRLSPAPAQPAAPHRGLPAEASLSEMKCVVGAGGPQPLPGGTWTWAAESHCFREPCFGQDASSRGYVWLLQLVFFAGIVSLHGPNGVSSPGSHGKALLANERDG